MAKIIIIDDDAIVRKVIKANLEKENYEVIGAEDALEGISKILSLRPELIILDVIMPQIDGYEALKLIKENDEFKDIPVIMLTAKDEMDDMLKGFDCGADDYISKPFDFLELLVRIRTLLKIRELQKKVLDFERMAAIGQVALTIRHEINNPLTAVVGQSEMLLEKEKKLPKEIRPHIENIYEWGNTIQTIILKLEKFQDEIVSSINSHQE